MSGPRSCKVSICSWLNQLDGVHTAQCTVLSNAQLHSVQCIVHSAQFFPMHNCTVHSVLHCTLAHAQCFPAIQCLECSVVKCGAALCTSCKFIVMFSLLCIPCSVCSVRCAVPLTLQCSIVQLCKVWQVCCSHYKLITENQPLIKRWWWGWWWSTSCNRDQVLHWRVLWGNKIFMSVHLTL